MSYAGKQLRVTVATYTVTASQPLSRVPLRVAAAWKPSAAGVDLTLDYLYNTAGMRLTFVSYCSDSKRVVIRVAFTVLYATVSSSCDGH